MPSCFDFAIYSGVHNMKKQIRGKIGGNNENKEIIRLLYLMPGGRWKHMMKRFVTETRHILAKSKSP